MTDPNIALWQDILKSYPIMIILVIIMYQVWAFLTKTLYVDIRDALRALLAWFQEQQAHKGVHKVEEPPS